MDEGTDDITSREILIETPDKNMDDDAIGDYPESPMQQSPDQSDFNDNCRSSGNVDASDEQVMDIGGSDLMPPKSPETQMEEETSHANECEDRLDDNTVAESIENDIVSSNEVESSENLSLQTLERQPVDISVNDIDSHADQVSDQASDINEEPEQSVEDTEDSLIPDNTNPSASNEIDSNYDNKQSNSNLRGDDVQSINEESVGSASSPEVSSTSNVKPNSETCEPENISYENEPTSLTECVSNDAHGNDVDDDNESVVGKDVVNINEVVTKNVQLAKWGNQGKLTETTSDIDKLSTMSVKGSVYSEGEIDEIELDLTKPDDGDSATLTKNNDVHIDNKVDDSICDNEMAAGNVSSSTKLEELPDDKTSPDEITELVESDLEERPHVPESTEVINEPDIDKKSEASLEEVSDDEDGEIDNDDENDNKDDNGSLEAVSSDEDEPELEEEKKAESGMEEISEEEDISDNASEDGMENVSSEEDEGDDSDVKKVLDEKSDETRTVEVKQNGETVTIDDSGKEDGAIVQEILENMTIKIENNSPDEKSEVQTKRRKSKDKKEKREIVKPRSKSTSSSHKDTRDISERLKAQANYGEDVELDYDDTVHDETKDRQGSESEGEIMSDSSSSAGLISEEEDCEEGEIREPGQKPYVKPTCRFFMRGHCTWGINCRFLHPGINDKGYYQLIERPGFQSKPPPPFEDKWVEEEVERTPSPEPPPPAPEPKEETAWERGLRQAKELRKKALERREMETNFEHKKMNLSIEENPEYDKENAMEKMEKSPVKKQPYYDKYEPLSDDEYYDQTPMRLQQKQMEQSWLPGQYENFEVRWTRDHYGPPPSRGPGPEPYPQRYPYPPESGGRERERFPLRPSPRRFSPSPPMQRQRYMRSPPPRDMRDPRDPREMMRRDKMREDPRMTSPPPPTKRPPSPGRPKADEWNDPWRRSNANKGKSPPKKRSRSRGRRRSRRSFSYSSSYSSSSYSGSSRSRSRSSSFSSISSRSRSSRSSSNSRSRSPVQKSVPKRGMRGNPPQMGPPIRRQSSQGRPNEPPRSSVSMRGRPGQERRSGGRGSPVRFGVRGSPMRSGGRGSPVKSVRNPGSSQNRQPPSRSGGPQMGDNIRMKKPGPKVQQSPQQPQRKFQMAVKSRDRPLPQSALTKDKGKPMSRKRSGSSSSSRSSSSSSRSSFSSRSSRSRSRSRSRSSSSSSSGSADSDHLYRNIGGRDNQNPAGPGRGKSESSKLLRPTGESRGPGRSGMKPNIGETSRPSSVAQAKMVKDPLQMKGLKSNIKLTLIKPNEKTPAGSGQDVSSRKRLPEPGQDVPPAKRPSLSNAPKVDKTGKRPDKPTPVSPTKAPSRPPGPAKPAPSVPVVPAATAAAAAAAGVVKKKSTVSRREELLKQLKAVEHAIAKKKKKMT